MNRNEFYLKLVLRLIGFAALSAIIFALLPFSMYQSMHKMAGLGEMPYSPIVGYAVRSLCLFWGLYGFLHVYASLDLDKHMAWIKIIGWSEAILGLLLLFIDLFEKLPLFWALPEGIMNIIVGLLIVGLAKKVEQSPK